MMILEAIHEFSLYRHLKVRDCTVIRYERELRTFCLCIGNIDIQEITLDHVVRYLCSMEKLGWKKNSLTVTALALRKFLEFFRFKGLEVLKPELIPLPRKQTNIPRVACKESYEKMIAVIPNTEHPNHIRNSALISMTWDTGARIGEILSIDVGDPNTDTCSAIIHTEKSRGKRPLREIFWTEETNERVKRWIAKRKELSEKYVFQDTDALFVTLVTTEKAKTKGRRMTNRGASEVFRMISNQAKLPLVNAHSFRHAMGRDIIRKGGSTADVANILGHSSPDSSMIYTMLFGKDLHERWELYRGS